ncbi:hypothetical protein BH11PLA1_BH11PLA1_01520 [soil metagenome]
MRTLTIVACLLALISLAAVQGGISGTGTSSKSVALADTKKRIDVNGIAALMQRIGISPDAMAAADFNDDDCDIVFTAMTAHWASPGLEDEIRTATQAANGGPIAQRPAARTTVENLMANALNVGVGALAPEKAATIRAIASGQRLGVPVWYRAIGLTNRSAAQWLELRNAITNVRISTQQNGASDTHAVSVVSDADNFPAVSAAHAAHTSRIAAIKARWKSFLADE